MPDDCDAFDLIRETVPVGTGSVRLVRPRSAEDLIDEEAYARDERLPYWAELWPSARVLANVLGERPLRRLRVLELGCGVGLPATVASLAGARVLATDWYPEALLFAARNARRAGAPIETMAADWRLPPPALLARAPFDLVTGADLLYEERNARALQALLPRLVTPGGEVLLADPRRPHAPLLIDALVASGWGHDCEERRHDGPLDETGPIVRLHHLRAARRPEPADGSRRGPIDWCVNQSSVAQW